MENPQMNRSEPEEMDVKNELKIAKVNLHNQRLQIQLQEVIVKKFEELAR